MLVDKQLPSLVGGVSQQPATARLSSQAETIDNAWLSVFDGLRTRNGTRHIAKMTADNLDGSYSHIINRDSTEQYIVMLDGVSVRVWDLEGNEKTVNFSADFGIPTDLADFYAGVGIDISDGDFFSLEGIEDTITGAFATAKGSALAAGDVFLRLDTAFLSDSVAFTRHVNFDGGASGVFYVGTPAQVAAIIANPTSPFAGDTTNAALWFSTNEYSVNDIAALDGTGDVDNDGFAAVKGSAPVDGDLFIYTKSTSDPGEILEACEYLGTSAALAAAVETPTDLTPTFNDYLIASDPQNDFVCVTVADYTFILNRTKIVRLGPADSGTAASGASTSPQPVHHWTMIPAYGGSQSDDPVPFGSGGFRGQRARQNQYTGNSPASGITGTVQTFQDLPTGATSGDIYLIKGSADSAFANYYVRSAGDNVWNETVKPGLRNRIDAATMPHALVRKADGTFEFGRFSWADRKVGDETTNPNPSFVAREIRDIFWYKNRFGVAVDEGVVLTRVGDFGNFYRLTVVDVLADDRIDIQASETKVAKINYAVPFDGSIMMFSDQTQFRLNHGREGLTPNNCSLDAVTNYKMLTNVRPFSLGSDVYFACPNGDFATIREYYVAPESQANDAANVTGHVPNYIPSPLKRISGSDTHDFLMVIPDIEGSVDRRLFVYQFHWVSETEKAQSAWNQWRFPAGNTLIVAEVLGDDVIVVTARLDGTHLERIPIKPGVTTDLTLDHQTTDVVAVIDIDGTTVFTLPYEVLEFNRQHFRLFEDGVLLANDPDDYTWEAADEVRLTGEFAGDFTAGFVYGFYYEFSEQFAMNAQNAPMLNGKLMLRNFTVYFKDTAYFEVEVAPYGQASPTTQPIIPALKAAGQAQTETLDYFVSNEPVFLTGTHQFGVFGESTQATVAVRANSPWPVCFTQAEWEGFFHKRSRTI